MATKAAYIDLTEGAAPATPTTGDVRIYAKTDGEMYQKDDAGTETGMAGGGGGDITTDDAWVAKGDLIVGTGANTAAILTAGTNGHVLTADSAEATGMKFAASAGGGALGYVTEKTAGATEADFDFTSIAGTGRHLIIEMMIRAARTNTYDDLRLQVNGDTGSNYDSQNTGGYGSTPFASPQAAAAYAVLGQPAAASATAGLFSSYRIMIPYYADTNWHKTMHILASEKTANSSGSFLVRETAIFWRSTSAISRVRIYFAGGNIAQYSKASLYLVS